MLSDFLPAIRLQLRLSRIFASIPYKWDNKLNRMVFEKSKKYLFFYRLGFFIHAVYAAFMMGSFIHMWVTKETDGITVAQVLSIGWICCHIGSGLLRAGVAHKMSDLLSLLNSFVEFEEDLTKKVEERVKGLLLIKMLLFFGCCASLAMPGFICAMLATSPCLPPMLGYTLMDCDDLAYPSKSFFLRYPILLFNVFTWFNAFGMAYFSMFPAFYLPMICLTEYLQITEKVTRRHVTNRIIRTVEDQRVLVTRMYRGLQLMTLKFNLCYSNAFLPVTLAACNISYVSSLFCIIRLHAYVPAAGMGFFFLKLAILTIMFKFVFGFGSNVYMGSNSILDSWSRVEGLEKLKWFKRSMKSFPTLKIQYRGGGGGFIDETFTLGIYAFVVDQTVNLLLIVPDSY